MMASKPEKQTRIFVWCWPRSISTALEKCLSFVDGVQIWHEPYTVAFNGEIMSNPDLTEHGGAIAAIYEQYATMVKSIENQPHEFSGGRFSSTVNFTYPNVKKMLEEEETAEGKKYILIKDMAMAVLEHIHNLPNVPSRHTFLIRHPHRFLLSQRKMFLRVANYQGDPADFNMFDASPMLKESFYTTDSMHWLWKHVQETGKDPNPIIIDAEDLLDHADKILPKYLEALGIPFHEKYLTWDASEESLKTWRGCTEQVVIGKRMGIFDKAFKSSCFLPNAHPEPTKEDLTPDLVKFGELLLPGYQEMYEKRIKPE